MSFYYLKLNITVILMVLALLNICTTETYTVSEKTDNKKLAEDRQNLTNNKQDLNISAGRQIKRHNPDHADRTTNKKQRKSIVSIDNKKMVELNFGWPIKGRVLKSFSPSRNKGIDIAGKRGQPVKATEAGKVVYGGQGLIGFGKLLIIMHNNDYLSAYANNSRLLVNEGQHVEKGQVIAEVGGVGIKRMSLHFEIRKKGKPVNPLKILP